MAPTNVDELDEDVYLYDELILGDEMSDDKQSTVVWLM